MRTGGSKSAVEPQRDESESSILLHFEANDLQNDTRSNPLVNPGENLQPCARERICFGDAEFRGFHSSGTWVHLDEAFSPCFDSRWDLHVPLNVKRFGAHQFWFLHRERRFPKFSKQFLRSAVGFRIERTKYSFSRFGI